jgi:tetratricopeptide (TPR) repeat protein
MQNSAANDLFNQAVAAIQAGERTRASDLFQQVLQLNPYAVEAWLYYAPQRCAPIAIFAVAARKAFPGRFERCAGSTQTHSIY